MFYWRLKIALKRSETTISRYIGVSLVSKTTDKIAIMRFMNRSVNKNLDHALVF